MVPAVREDMLAYYANAHEVIQTDGKAMAKTDIRVSGSLREAAAEVATAWKAAAAGKPISPSDRILFRDWDALYAVVTPKRMELLRHLRAEPAESLRALARSLKRDVKRVHQDVAALSELGVIERDEVTGRLSSKVDEITSTIRIDA